MLASDLNAGTHLSRAGVNNFGHRCLSVRSRDSLRRVEVEPEGRQVVSQGQVYQGGVGFGRFDESEQADDAVLVGQHRAGDVFDRVVRQSLRKGKNESSSVSIGKRGNHNNTFRDDRTKIFQADQTTTAVTSGDARAQ